MVTPGQPPQQRPPMRPPVSQQQRVPAMSQAPGSIPQQIVNPAQARMQSPMMGGNPGQNPNLMSQQPEMGQWPPMIRSGGPPVTATVGQQPLQPLNQQRFPMQNQPPPGQPQQLPVSSAPATSTAPGAPMMNRYKQLLNMIYRAFCNIKQHSFYLQ